ncbi:MAG TPA: hypothetical protein VEK15_14440 [Vicinamibacteria bacterium]|nr:hypothetical protein [Vicinamibacteria bacterium]
MKRVAVLVCLALPACTSYEYEEDVTLEVDGSGRIRISGSAPMFHALLGIEDPSTEALEEFFNSAQVEIESIRRTERGGRSFFHVRMIFASWNDVCRHRAFRDRGCSLVFGASDRVLTLALPRPRGGPATSVDPGATLGFRFHFPSTVLEHNAPRGVERGNILGWRRTWSAHRDGPPLEIRARFDQRSVLSATVRVLVAALGVVGASIATALILVVRKGRRQIASGPTL